MNLSTSYYIGLRYTFSKRSSGFLSFITTFAIGGMALGVFALVVVLSVMNGFDREIKQRLLRAVPHGYVSAKSGLEDWRQLKNQIQSVEGYVASAPFVGGTGLLSHRQAVSGAMIRGIDPSVDVEVSPVAKYVVSGALSELEPGEYGIVLGSLLAYKLGAYVGESLTLTLPQLSITLGGAFPRTRKFKVVGIFQVNAQVDETLALVHINDAQKLFRRGHKVDGLRIKFDDLYTAPAGMKAIQAQLGENYRSTDWSQSQGSLFQAVKLEKTVTGILLGIIVAVAAFNIVTSLIMMVSEKNADIAVLRTMGMSRRQVFGVFIFQGGISGFLGIFLGLVSGIPCALYLPNIIAFLEALLRFQVFDENVYYVTSLPSLWLFSDTLIIALFAMFSSVLATLYPAYRASIIEPAEAIRYDH